MKSDVLPCGWRKKSSWERGVSSTLKRALSLGTGTAAHLLKRLKRFILQRNGSQARGPWALILSVLEIRKKRENENNHFWKRRPLMTTPPAACRSLCFLLFSVRACPRAHPDKGWTDRWTTHLHPAQV